MAKTNNKARYRYILCGIVSGTNSISDFRLIAANNLGDSHSAIRVRIPNDMKLCKWSCDTYSTTEDNRTLDELGYDVIINFNGHWKLRNDLKGIQPHEFHNVLQKEGYYTTHDGYLTKEEYRNYMAKLIRKLNEDHESETIGPIWNENNNGDIVFIDDTDDEIQHPDQKYVEALVRKAIELEVRPGKRMVKFFNAKDLPIYNDMLFFVSKKKDATIFKSCYWNTEVSACEDYLVVQIRSGSYKKSYTVKREDFVAEDILLDFERCVEEALPLTEKFKNAYLDYVGHRVVFNITDKNDVSFVLRTDKTFKVIHVQMTEINNLDIEDLCASTD